MIDYNGIIICEYVFSKGILNVVCVEFSKLLGLCICFDSYYFIILYDSANDYLRFPHHQKFRIRHYLTDKSSSTRWWR